MCTDKVQDLITASPFEEKLKLFLIYVNPFGGKHGVLTIGSNWPG